MMKNFKIRKYLAVYVLLVLLLAGGIAFAARSVGNMPKDAGLNTIPVFAPVNIISVDNGTLTVSGYSVIMFNADVTIQINGSGSTYDWPADTPLGIGSGVTSLTLSGLSGATTALVM